MNTADILMYGFLLAACCTVAGVSWAAGKAHASRMYAADLATARTAARHYRAERDSAQGHLDMIRRTTRPTMNGADAARLAAQAGRAAARHKGVDHGA